MHDPGIGRGRLVRHFDLGPDRADAAAQIIAEPANDEKDPFDTGQRRLQIIEREPHIGHGAPRTVIFRRVGAAPGVAPLNLGIVDTFARTGDQGHGAHEAFKTIARARQHPPEDFEVELRQAVAEFLKRQIIEHNIGQAAICGRIARSFNAFDQRIGHLRGCALIDPHGNASERQGLSISPDPPDPINRAFAKPHREIREIGIGLGLDRAAAATPALAACSLGADHFLEARRPDDLTGNPHPPRNFGDGCAFG